MDPSTGKIQREEDVWVVVWPQPKGRPLKFRCESEREAKHFLQVLQRPPRGKQVS